MRQLHIEPDNAITALVGICKNAGKTTVLNWLLTSNSAIRFGILSTGRDGEERDSVFANAKPAVSLSAGTLYCTDTSGIAKQGSNIRILAKTTWLTGKRNLWLAEALCEIKTEIFGPSAVDEQIACARTLLELGARHILIDGSIDRKSIVLNSTVNNVILVAGASFGSLQQVKEELKRLMTMTTISRLSPDRFLLHGCESEISKVEEICIQADDGWQKSGIKTLYGHEKDLISRIDNSSGTRSIYIPGALTDRSFALLHGFLRQKSITLIIPHSYHLNLGYRSLEQLLQDIRVMVLNPFKIKAIALNPWCLSPPYPEADIWRQELMSERERYPDLYGQVVFFDVMDMNNGFPIGAGNDGTGFPIGVGNDGNGFPIEARHDGNGFPIGAGNDGTGFPIEARNDGK